MFNIYIRVNGAPNAQEILGYPAPKFVVDEKAAMSLKFKPSIFPSLSILEKAGTKMFANSLVLICSLYGFCKFLKINSLYESLINGIQFSTT